MTKYTAGRKIILLAFTILAFLSSHSQQQFAITSSRANNYCNGTCTLFDNPDLNGNPTAVIFITPVEINGIDLNPHPICAYYNGKQWSVMNVDNSTIPTGSQFNVQYYSRPDENHFLHVVTKGNLVKNNSYIDQAALNGNPKAVFKYFQNASPNVRGGYVNKDEIRIGYDEAAAKWFIAKLSGNPLDVATGYNIFIAPGAETKTNTNSLTPLKTLVTTPVTTGPSASRPIDAPDYFILMTVVGKTQGPFAGDNTTSKITVHGFELEENSPRDLSSGQSNGKRQYSLIQVQKSVGSSSVQFFKAIASNEQLSTVTFEVYKLSERGIGILDYKIILTNASIANFRQSYTDADKKETHVTETIKLSFQSIEINYAGTGVTDTWQQ